MKIKLNPDPQIVNTIKEGLKKTGGYCPCRREKTDIVFSAPFIGNDDRGVFFMCVRVHTKTSNFFHGVFTLSS